jgi:hypothetical protein
MCPYLRDSLEAMEPSDRVIFTEIAWRFWTASGGAGEANRDDIARKLHKALTNETIVIVSDGPLHTLHYTILGVCMVDAYQRQN